VRILIDNAMRYGPPGEPIELDTSTRDGVAGVSVADSGPGIPPEEREHIFERFHRGRAAGSESGFGLGLAIGRELAERMGGRTRVEDGSRGGARFLVELPESGPGTGDLGLVPPDQDLAPMSTLDGADEAAREWIGAEQSPIPTPQAR